MGILIIISIKYVGELGYDVKITLLLVPSTLIYTVVLASENNFMSILEEVEG